jgi:hypothetical protein
MLTLIALVKFWIFICQTNELYFNVESVRLVGKSSRMALRMQMEMNLEAWASTAGIEFSNTALASFNGLRGMRAANVLNGQDVLVKVPSDAVLEVTNSGQRLTPFSDFVAQDTWKESKWDQRLAFKLLWELKIDESANISSKKDWFASLPKKFSTPLHWSNSLLQETQYSQLPINIANQKKLWKSNYNAWQQQAKIYSAPNADQIQFSDFVWALEVVNSRAFSGVYEGSTLSDRQNLLLFTGGLTLLWPLLGFGTYEQ